MRKFYLLLLFWVFFNDYSQNVFLGKSYASMHVDYFDAQSTADLKAGISNSDSSKDKNSNIESIYFWVVKLKDKHEVKMLKNSIGAIRNPMNVHTNLITGL